jgi:hypothetical protein
MSTHRSARPIRRRGAATAPQRRRVRWVTGAVMVTVAVVASSACTSAEQSTAKEQVTTVHGTPAVASALHGPGTPLGDGFHVPNGAALVGASLPNRRLLSGGAPKIRSKRNWSAVLLVKGRGDAVARDLAAQAQEAGLRSDLSLRGFSCMITNRGESPLGIVVSPPTERPDGLMCGGSLESAERIALYSQGIRSLQVSTQQGACIRCPSGRSPSLAVVQYVEVDDAAERSPELLPPATGVTPVIPPVRATRPPLALPHTGTKIRLNFDGTTTPVIAGSGALIPPLCNGCETDLWMMQPTDGDRVFEAYARALNRLDIWENGPTQRREARDGWRVRAWSGGNTDTGIDVELFQRKGEPDLLRISLSNGA